MSALLLGLSIGIGSTTVVSADELIARQQILAEKIKISYQGKKDIENQLATIEAKAADRTSDLSIELTLEKTVVKALENIEVDLIKDKLELQSITLQLLSLGNSGKLPSLGDGSFTWPVEGYFNVSQGYGQRHAGVDINTMGASPNILAVQAGVVIRVANIDGYGNQVVIDHGNGLMTQYAHMQEIHVALGSYVEEGAVLGLVGNTGWSQGKHLHLQLTTTGNLEDQSINPSSYLK